MISYQKTIRSEPDEQGNGNFPRTILVRKVDSSAGDVWVSFSMSNPDFTSPTHCSWGSRVDEGRRYASGNLSLEAAAELFQALGELLEDEE